MLVGGLPVISAGAILTGTTADVVSYAAANAQTGARMASLRIEFTRIADQNGHAEPIACVLVAVDNARETVDSAGVVTGIDPSQTYEAQLNRAIDKLQTRASGLAQLLEGVESSIVKQVDASIDYKPGVELTLKLTNPLVWNFAPAAKPLPPVRPASEIDRLVNSEPFRTIAQRPPEPSDLTNIMLIGAQQEIEVAFQAAGWFPAAALSRSSKIETARAMIEDRGYSEAPMSILLLQGRPTDLALQNQNNTFARRHHIRIWRMPQIFDGKPVWVGAATHDIKITFSPESRSFTHGIDSKIDLERSNVVDDLLFTGMVRACSLVPRTNIPRDLSNATGDQLITDGKMAVLEFQ